MTAAELDPRIERSRRVVQEAAIEEMAEVGYGAMTVEGVAKRAGVSKATIYRQWKSKLEVVESALRMLKSDMAVDETAPPREQVVQLLTSLARYLSDPDNPSSACVPALVSAAHYDESVREFHHRFTRERHQVLVDTIVAGQADGDIAASLDPSFSADLLAGPIFFRRLMSATPFPPADVPALVNSVLGPA